MSKKDHDEFQQYLDQCTDLQVEGVYEKERDAGRSEYAHMAKREMEKRGPACVTMTA